MDDENIMTLVDEETGTEIKLELVDSFEHNGKTYDVFLTIEEKEEDSELVFMEEVTQDDGEVIMMSLEDDEEDEVYNTYLDLIETSLDEQDDEE
ncbi:MAG: DUF1292 domain-containing protein [Saccharofermentans sp.]|nr:DUF1292 domain-containing protein [Saccharofermentans sp.]